MKKIIALVLALLLVASLGVTAFAETNDGKAPSSATVRGKYEAGDEAPETISVDVTWEDMKFTYREGSKEWNPDTHEYEQLEGKWDETPKNIKVVNNSNINVLCNVKCVWNDGIIGGFGTVGGSSESEYTTTINSPKNASYYELSQPIFVTGGKLTTAGNIGTVTVTISSFE